MFTPKVWNSSLLVLAALAAMLLLAASAMWLEKPVGGLAGQVALKQPGFGISTTDIKNNKVYAVAIGPRGPQSIERGVWVKPDGRFNLQQLPVGEYSLKVRAPGFATYDEQGVFVDEGKVTAIAKPVQLEILEPSVNIASNSRVFTTREHPHFWINALGARHAKVRIYGKVLLPDLKKLQHGPKELDFGSDLNLYKPSRSLESSLFGNAKPLQVLERKLESDQEDWARAEFKLSKPLPPGDYLARVDVSGYGQKRDWNMLWFTVTDLGLVLKQAPEKAWVRAIDLNTLKPQAGVSVQWLDRDTQQALGAVQTNQEGFALLPMPADKALAASYNLLAYGTQGQQHAYGGLPFWRDSADHYQTYFYTERPVYRLGQTVYFKGITRLLDGDGFHRPQGALPVRMVIEDPDNNKLWEQTLHTNPHGTFNGIYEIPTDGKTGAYQVTLVYPDNTSSYERFEVAQYRKPEYQVEVLPATPRVVGGETLKVRIRASYYFGAPVQHARVKYSIYAAPDWNLRERLLPHPAEEDFYDSWDSDADAYGDGYAGDYVSEGYAQTDENGEAVVEVKTQPIRPTDEEPYDTDYWDKRYKIQAEVTDISRMAVTSSGNVSVTAGSYALFVDPKRYVYKVGEPAVATITAVNYEGKPVANQTVALSLIRWVWDRHREVYRKEVSQEGLRVTTDAAGQGTLSFNLPNALATDTYYLAAQAQDAQGHHIFQQTSFWIASPASPYAVTAAEAPQQPLAVKMDKAVYQPGETAKVMISAPVTGQEGVDAIVAVEGSKLHDVRVVRLKATAQLVEIPLKPEYAPNAYITVTFVGRQHQFYNQSELIKISPQRHFLQVAVTTDKAKYHPGETVQYTVQVRDAAGKPAANTEVSLGVVDESIYAIRPETAEDIQKFFYRKRPNWVMTTSSFPEEYSGGPDKVEPRIRKDFRDMAAWMPTLITNAQGIVKTSVRLPDNLTTWRATVRAVTLGTDVGSTLQKIVSTQDLLVRLALPRFFTQGDQGFLTAIVHNYTEQPQRVRLNLEASEQFQPQAAVTQSLQIAPDQAKRFSWPTKILQAGDGWVRIKAIGQTAGDAMELKLPVRPLAIQAFASQAGVLEGDVHKLLPFQLPADVLPHSAKLRLAMAPSAIGPVLGSFSSLIDYPYGCTEQTMSRLLPSVIAVQLHQDLGVPLDNASQQRFQTVYNKGMAILRDSRHEDGGWGWWQYDASNPYLTAYVLEGLSLLKHAGYPVPSELTQGGIAWLKQASQQLTQQLKDPKRVLEKRAELEAKTDLAYMLLVLSLYKEALPPQVTQWALANVGTFPPEALSYLTLALQEAGQTTQAQKAYAALWRLANRTDGAIDWEHTKPLLRRLGLEADAGDYTYRFTGAESTALALRAVVRMEPDNRQRLEPVKQWLLLQRNQAGWDNTKTTAAVLRALLAEEIAYRQAGESDFELKVQAAQTLLVDLQVTSANLYEAEQVVQASYTQLPTANLSLEKQGSGRLYYQSLWTYLLPLTPGAEVKQKPLPTGLHIQRRFYHLEAGALASNGTLRFTTRPLDGNRVKAGETVLMQVEIDSPIALPYVMIDSALPSGGEVVLNDPRESLLSAEDNPLEGNWGPWWWSHQDVLDDRVVFFATQLPAGKATFHTLVRMELPGTFQMNPVKLEGMYTQKVKAYSGLDQLHVVE